MAYLISKRIRFEAAHKLPDHDGKCARLHGHSWRADITVASRHTWGTGPQTGMAWDFGRLKDHLRPLLEDELDHYYLNDSLDAEMLDGPPTSELVARYICRWIDKNVAFPEGVKLSSVTVFETCTSAAEYFPPSKHDPKGAE